MTSRILKWLWWGVVAFLIVTVLWVLVYRFVPVPGTPLMLIRNTCENIKANYRWTPIENIAADMQLAVIAAEDSRFMQHNGFDWEQIEKAQDDARKGKKLRGASTISQQTAKNVFLWNGRSWIRKGFEAYFTILIETLWSKERIMEVYLNCIEMGEGLYGVAAVAEANFGKSADKLTRKECALIAATLPNPRRFSSKRPSEYIKKRRTAILRNMSYIEKKGLHKN